LPNGSHSNPDEVSKLSAGTKGLVTCAGNQYHLHILILFRHIQVFQKKNYSLRRDGIPLLFTINPDIGYMIFHPIEQVIFRHHIFSFFRVISS